MYRKTNASKTIKNHQHLFRDLNLTPRVAPVNLTFFQYCWGYIGSFGLAASSGDDAAMMRSAQCVTFSLSCYSSSDATPKRSRLVISNVFSTFSKTDPRIFLSFSYVFDFEIAFSSKTRTWIWTSIRPFQSIRSHTEPMVCPWKRWKTIGKHRSGAIWGDPELQMVTPVFSPHRSGVRGRFRAPPFFVIFT